MSGRLASRRAAATLNSERLSFDIQHLHDGQRRDQQEFACTPAQFHKTTMATTLSKHSLENASSSAAKQSTFTSEVQTCCAMHVVCPGIFWIRVKILGKTNKQKSRLVPPCGAKNRRENPQNPQNQKIQTHAPRAGTWV